MAANDVFNISLTLLKFIGEYMHTRSKFLMVYRSVNVAIMSISLIFVVGPLFLKGQKNFVKIVEAILAVGHPLLKYLLLVYNKSDVESILSAASGNFWDSSDFDGHFIAEERRFYKLIRSTQLVLPISSLSAVIFFMLRPAFHKNTLYIVETWIVNSISVNAVSLMFQYYIFLVLVPVIMGYDSLYLALCVNVVVQLKRLKYKLEKLSSSHDGKNNIIRCIRYHQFLLAIFVKMKNMFSLTLLFHYFVTLISCCFELYGLMGYGNFDIEQVLNVFVLFCQFGYYAFPADQVASEFEGLSNGLYMSKWYENSSNSQKLMLFLMAKSQRSDKFSGGGVIPMNVDTFGAVFRKSFSFYAVLRKLLDK